MNPSNESMDSRTMIYVRKFLEHDALSPGFVEFIGTRSFILRAAIVATSVLGKRWEWLWPLSLVGRFLRANSVLFEDLTKVEPVQRRATEQTDWTTPLYDVVVVGSGPGGSVSALRHIERGSSTLIVEEGPDVPTGSISHHSVSQARLQLRDLGFQIIYGRTPVAFAQGRTVGGGSEVNSGLYHRLPPPYRKNLLSFVGCSESQWSKFEETVEKALQVQRAPAEVLSKYQDSARDFISGSAALDLDVEEVARWRTYGPETHNGMKNTYIEKFLEKGGYLPASPE